MKSQQLFRVAMIEQKVEMINKREKKVKHVHFDDKKQDVPAQCCKSGSKSMSPVFYCGVFHLGAAELMSSLPGS